MPRAEGEGFSLKKTGDPSVFVNINFFRRWNLGKPRHCHNVSRERNDEARARGDLEVADRYLKAARRAEQGGIVGKAVLCFGDADGSNRFPQAA